MTVAQFLNQTFCLQEDIEKLSRNIEALRILATSDTATLSSTPRSPSPSNSRMADIVADIADLERGEARLSVQGLINLCGVFHCSADYLLFGRTDSLSMAARIDALPPALRMHIEELIAKQLAIIQCAEALGREP